MHGCVDFLWSKLNFPIAIIISEQQRKGAVPMVTTLQNLIDSTFKNAAKKFENSGGKIEKGDAILAKMSGYCAWPAHVDGFTQNRRRIKCFFYGSHNIGSVDINQVIPFKEAFALIRLINLRNPRDFAKGVREIELKYGVPDELSALREIEAIA